MLVQRHQPAPDLAVHVDDLRLDLRAGLRAAREIGFRAVELTATEGPIAPQQLSRTGRRDLAHHLGSLGLTAVALSAAPRGGGYADPRTSEAALEQTRRVLSLAYDLRVPTVTTAVVPPDDADSRGQATVREVLAALAEQAYRTGRILAVAPQSAAAEWLADLLRELACPNLRGCLDTGEWLAYGLDPADAARFWTSQIGAVHLRDATRGTPVRPGRETVPGLGALELPRALAGLSAAGYSGPLILRREAGGDPLRELAAARRVWAEVAPPA